MKRVAQVITVKPERIAEYEEVHAAVWPAVLETLRRHHVTNYSIYRHGDLLVSYFEYLGDDYDADMAGIAADPETQRWWTVTDPMQERVPEAPEGEWWHPLPEVFHLP
ncbi:L-rhamnose mutarotase [Pseudactinotalea sp.]|uniref:L-rhamnose mutarotase n=1 Tax=Pseudactinotalea sp. TaxID=1926260 RepID=UPI003B3B8187